MRQWKGLPKRLQESAYVVRELPGIICQRCQTTLETFPDQCTAGLAELCPGYEAIEAKKAEFQAIENRRGLTVSLTAKSELPENKEVA